MNQEFREHVEALHPKFEMLMALKPIGLTNLADVADKPGIYLLSEGPEHLYIGRAKKIRSRLKMQVGTDPAGASFAVKLARQTTKRLATYTQENSLRVLRQESAFVTAFGEARERIRAMQIRFVEEPDCNRQALLEIYATLSLKTPYNDFETHETRRLTRPARSRCRKIVRRVGAGLLLSTTNPELIVARANPATFEEVRRYKMADSAM